LKSIKECGNHRLLALTNWSAESFPIAKKKFEFLDWFEGVVVSGVEKTRKPYPQFYHILFDRYQVDPAKAIFIDDNIKNVHGGRSVGLHVIHFQNPEQLREEMKSLGINMS
jgi:2-haloacid dehalogenase